MKTALVLEGGAMRGLYTAGVIDSLLENNIKVDAIIGVSQGALLGINYASKQKGRGIRYNRKYIKNKNYIGFYSLLKTGNIVNKEFCFNTLPNKLDIFDYEEYYKSNLDYYVTVTNVETGEPEYHKVKKLEEEVEYLRASSSMPLVSKIVKINDKKYLDGGVADSIPVKKAIELGYEKIIVVLTRPIEYSKKKVAIKPYELRYKEYPKFIDAMKIRHIKYNETVENIKELESKNEIFVIRPTKDLKIKRLEKNIKKINSIYELGVNDCNEKIKELKNYLK